MQTEITIPGRPTTKKNSQQITWGQSKKKPEKNRMTAVEYKEFMKGCSNSPFIRQSEYYEAYEEKCLWELKSYRGPRFKDTKLHVRCQYYMPNRRSWPDLVGLMQATWDILEKAGIIDNDRNVVNPDGTRIVGVDKENPRVEIFIEEEEKCQI